MAGIGGILSLPGSLRAQGPLPTLKAGARAGSGYDF